METVTTKRLYLEEVCIEKAQLKILLQNAGLLQAAEPSGEAVATSTAQ